MAKTGKVALLEGVKGHFYIEEHELPKVEPNTLLLKTKLTGLCATDVRHWIGNLPTHELSFPALFGHEVYGEIIELGEGCDKDYMGKPLKVGDHIAIKPAQHCGKCYYCSAVHLPEKCEASSAYGVTHYQKPWFTGGYGEYVYLHFQNSVFFKTDLAPETAILLDPTTNVINGINRGKQRIGDMVVIQGTGPIGLLATVLARQYGASKIIMVGGPPQRLALAKELGADITIDINEVKDMKERVKMVLDVCNNGRGADIVYECAGFPATIPEGIDYLRFGGTFVEMGNFTDAGEVVINPSQHICSKCATIVGAWASENGHYVQAISLLENRFRDLGSKLVTHQVGLDGIEAAFQSLASDYVMNGKEVVKVGINPWM